MTLKKLCLEYDLDYAKALVFLFCLENQKEGTLDVFTQHFLDEETELYRINLATMVNGELAPKVFEDEDYNTFIAYLKQSGMTSTGYEMYNTNYVVFKIGEDLKRAFTSLRKKTPATTEQIVNQVYKFYTSEAKFKPSLDKYLSTSILSDL